MVFWADGGEDVGFGHLRRSLVLARHFQAGGAETSFLYANKGGIVPEAMFSGIGAIQLSWDSRFQHGVDQISGMRRSNSERYIVFFDVVHKDTLVRSDMFQECVKALKSQEGFIVVVDAFGEESVRAQADISEIDMLIAPYVGEKSQVCNVKPRMLLGSRYFIAESDFRDGERHIRRQGNRILITCGGSDPDGVSIRLLEAVKSIKMARLHIRVVQGPFFGMNLRKELSRVAMSSNHEVELLNVSEPADMTDYMRWCDLAIGASGLTKYEFSMTGTPAILVSTNQAANRINQIFSACGSALNLGCINQVGAADIRGAICCLLRDPAKRKGMSEAGRNLVDGLGVHRIERELKSEIEHGL